MLPLYIMLSHDVNTFGKCFKLFRKSLVNKKVFYFPATIETTFLIISASAALYFLVK